MVIYYYCKKSAMFGTDNGEKSLIQAPLDVLGAQLFLERN